MFVLTDILRGLMNDTLLLGIIGSLITILLTIIGTLLLLDRKDMKDAIKAIGTGLEALGREFKEDIRRVHERIDSNAEDLSSLRGRCDAITKGGGHQ